jgi:MinD-like ATPase involved in chromosome partitioning or flagellar assembly
MYVTTYYSYKGGVGRTMALVNVALALAKEGRKVLLVDFDLEAPGLETFEALQAPSELNGVVEFVCSYQSTGEAPDVRDYAFERSEHADKGGRLWVMPAGRRDRGYESRLNSIRWDYLYAECEGYLFFEDLKAQWKEAFAPDYVFLDSRTGHTDVGGICTRQLPDAVVLLFFPNDQNLIGLTRVVEDIRGESERRRRIELHFVTSNVPDLDDEDSILAERLQRFKSALGYSSPSATIHHYPSLALLNQVVFSVERPRSRLAQEYRALQREIVKQNPGDRQGVLDYINDAMTERGWASDADLEGRIEAITEVHGEDGEIIFQIGLLERLRGRFSEAAARFFEAEKAGWRTVELFREKLRLSDTLRGEPREVQEQIQSDAVGILSQENVLVDDVALALGHLMRVVSGPILDSLPSFPAYQSLNIFDRASLVYLFLSKRNFAIAEAIIEDVLSMPGGLERLRTNRGRVFSLGLISANRFTEARELLGPEVPDFKKSTETIFNYAMAEWGRLQRPVAELFELVVEKNEFGQLGDLNLKSPNYLQCMAIAYWVAGDPLQAEEYLESALAAINGMNPLTEVFSCWSYLLVTKSEFREDLEEIRRLIGGEGLVPAFVSRRRGR